MASSAMLVTTAALDWISAAFDAPLARAVIFGVHIDGRLSYFCILIGVDGVLPFEAAMLWICLVCVIFILLFICFEG